MEYLTVLYSYKGEIFVGTFYSTFTGYINRIRGYRSQKESYDRTGVIESYYNVPEQLSHFRERMRMYHSVEPAFWQQEWPVAWRDIDNGVADDILSRLR